jgi:hypothetical protein
MKDEKGFKQYENESKGKNPGQTKKNPDRGRWIFKGNKNPEHHFLRRGSKAVGKAKPCRRFTACKRTFGHE